MTIQTEQFQKYVEFQREAFEPFRAFGDVAAQTFERLARQNYAVLGDYVEFAVEQARLPAQAADLNDYVGKQLTSTRAFGEKLAKRTQEYAEIARTAQDAATSVVAEKRAHKKAA
ncbi:MAG: phasin family protein [Gammaproteobacteria bacterium]|nr:phasin family protein [Gammaproteobacteria bacterium]